MTYESGGSSGGIRPPRKPRRPPNKFHFDFGAGAPSPAPAPQPIISSGAPVKKKPGPYSVSDTAWGPDYFRNTPQLRNTLTTLRNRTDEETLNGFLADLMTHRYEVFENRLENQYSRQRTNYQSSLERAVDRARSGQTFDIPEAPKVEGPGPGQGINALLKAYSNQLKGVKSGEEKDALAKFYEYELERLTGYLNDVHDQRNSLRSYYRGARGEIKGIGSMAESDEAAQIMDPDPDYIRQQLGQGKRRKNSDETSGSIWDLLGNAAGQNPAWQNYKPEEEDSDQGFLGKLWDNTGGATTNFLWGNDGGVHKALSKIGDEVEDPLMWTIDKLSRPLFGVNNAGKEFFALDEDKDPGATDVSGQIKDFLFSGGLSGQGLHESFDEFADDPLGALDKIGSGFLEGFTGKDKTTFGHVIAANAERDPSTNFYDNNQYQLWAGLTGDILYDPINLVGAGIVTKPVNAIRGAKAAKDLENLTKTSEDVAQALSMQSPVGSMHRPLETDEILNLLTGGLGDRLPRSASERKAALVNTHRNVEYLVQRINNLEDSTGDASELVRISDLGRALREQREAVLKEAEGDTLLQSLRRTLGIKESRGSLPPGTLQGVEESITASEIAKVLPQAYALGKTQERIANSLNIGDTRADALRDIVEGNGRKFQGNVEHLTGRKESLYVQDSKLSDGSNSTARIERTAWQNLQDEYDNLVKAHGQKLGTVREQRERAVKLDKMRKVIAEGLDESDYKSFRELMPDALRYDPRFTEKDWEEIYGVSMRLARETNPDYRKFVTRANSFKKAKVTSARRALETARRDGNESKIRWAENNLESALRRLQMMENQRDIIQADIILKLLNRRIDKGLGHDIFAEHTQFNALKDEAASLKDELKTLDGTSVDDQGRIAEIEHRLDDIKTERKNLSSLPGADRVKIGRVPASLANDEGKISKEDLRRLITFDRQSLMYKTGTAKTPEESSWLADVKNKMQETYEEIYDARRQAVYTKAREAAKSRGKSEKPKDWPPAVQKQYYNDLNATEIESGDIAFDQVLTGLNHHTLTKGDYSSKIETMMPTTMDSTETQLLKAVEFKFGVEKAKLLQQQEIARSSKDKELLATIENQLEGLREQHKSVRESFEQSVVEAKETRKLLKQRLYEDALLRVASLESSPMRKQLSIALLGEDLAIPGSQVLFKAAEKAMGVKGIKETKQIFANAFRSPASQLSPEAALVRNRQVSHTPNIIEHHINYLKNTLGQVREYERISGFNNILKGHNAPVGEEATQDAIDAAFKDIIPYFQNKERIGDTYLSVNDINRYLADEFKLDVNWAEKNGIHSVNDLVTAMKQNKRISKGDRKELQDPYRISWNLRVGIEQAMARKALETTIYKAFGVKKITGNTPEAKRLEGVFSKFKERGWTEVNDLSDKYMFPPEIVPDIKKLLELMEPRNISSFGRLADRATGYWKTATTVYNPGYWTRNGIGEVMSSWFAGVWDPRWYKSAMDTIKYARQDGKELKALQDQFPLVKYIPSGSVEGSKQAFKLGDGTPVSHEQVWVAYNDQGLKTGFINTEFDQQYSKLGDTIRGSEAGALANTHSKMRSAGEWYEDYLRMAHFQHAMKNSGAKTLQGAAEHAAKEVRKYHFDYTDFTNFEKTVMLRAFPFYKWTRKALPLMMTMLFTKPGKVLAYNKVMNTTSNALTTENVSGDDNGFAPNYEGIVPGWMQDLWAYKIAEYGDNQETFLNINTPQMDVYKNVDNPADAMYSLLNPLIKVPTERVIGKPLNSLWGKGFDVDYNDNDSDGKEFLDQLANQTPQTNFLGKVLDDKAYTEDKLAFLTGLGIYQNNDKRRMGESMNND